MPPDIKLIWENPSIQLPDRQSPVMLRMLGDFLAGASRMGCVDQARQIATVQNLTPLAATVVCEQMRSSGIGEDMIRKIV